MTSQYELASTGASGRRARSRAVPRRAIAGTGLAAAIALALMPGATGCTTHVCDPNSYDYFGGFMLPDGNTYVTSDWNDPWLDFHAATTIRVWFPPEVAGRCPLNVFGWVGTDQTPNGGPDFAGGDNYSPSVGQLAYFNFLSTAPSTQAGHATGGGFWVGNSTCAKYYGRWVVQFAPASDGPCLNLPNASPPTDDASPDSASGDDSSLSDAPGDTGASGDGGVPSDATTADGPAMGEDGGVPSDASLADATSE